MYTRTYQLSCEGYTFESLMTKNNLKPPPGFIKATDDHFDATSWIITSHWIDKESFEAALQHPMRKLFWNRFEMEAFKHDLKLVVIDGDTGESYEPLSID